jgi:Domain of unknown function (DUF4157)/A nuclease family of the HNH/ENDO VII superfamily with conserved AHH
MTLERSKKPSQVALEAGKPKPAAQTQTPGAKTPFVPMSAAQLQRTRARFDRDTAALQRSANQANSATRTNSATQANLIPQNQIPDQHIPSQAVVPNTQSQQAFHAGFVKPLVQRQSLERIKNQSIQTSNVREQYQAAIIPETLQRLTDAQMQRRSNQTRAAQTPNALNARTDWFNTELPVLRARHNNPNQPELDNASVFGQSDARARNLGKTYVAQRLSSGLNANDAATAIVNIQRSRDRNNALKGMLSAIRPQDSDYSRIQRLVSEKEHDLELQRRAVEETMIPQALQLAKEEANPTQANSGISEKIKAKIGGGSPLPEHVRSQLETGLNTNLEHVRVHTDAEADVLAKSVNAIAFTSGQDIFFSSGSYNPNTKTGYELIAHEVTHTIQQAGGLVQPGVDKSSSLETAAQAKGAELAATFDEHAKPAVAKPSLKPSSSSVPTNLALQRDAAGPLNQLLSTPATETIGKYDGTVSAVNSELESKKAKEQQGLPDLPTPTGMPAKGSAQGKTNIPGGKTAKASDPRIPSGNTPVANVRVPQIAGKPPQARTHIAAGTPSTATTTDGKPPQADPAVAAKANNELENVSTSADHVTTSMGEPPKVQLTGDLDPALMEENRKQHDAEIKTQEDQAAKDREHNFGENDIAPKPRTGKVKSQKKLAMKKIATKGGSSVKVKAELKAKLDASLSSPLQTKLRPEADKAVNGEKTQDQAMVKERSKADKDIKKLETDTAKDQGLQKTQSQNMVKEQRKTWKLETEKIQTKFDTDAKSKYTTHRANIKLEETKGNSEANRIIKDANRDAKSKADETEQKAKDEKNNAKSESKGFFGWVADKAASLVNKLKDAINAIYDTLRSVVKTIFEAAKILVTAAIDLAAKAIKGLITAFGEALKLLASVALAAFPELKQKFCDFIDKGVETANAYVDKAADILKTAVTAVLDFLASTIDKLLSLIQDLYNAALTVIGMILKGEFKELLEKLGHLVTAIKGVTLGGIGIAIKGQFLGDLNENLSPAEVAQYQGGKGGAAPEGAGTNDKESLLPANLEGNVSVDNVATLQLSPELQQQLLEKGDGEIDLGTSSDPSRSVEGIKKEIEKQQTGDKGQEAKEGKNPPDGLTPAQRGDIRWANLKTAASEWWGKNWGYVVAGGIVAIAGIAAVLFFSGGTALAALGPIMQVLTAVFIAQTIAQVGGYVSSFVSKSWAGDTGGGTLALNDAIGVGVVELVSYLTMKAGSAVAKVGKAAAKTTSGVLKTGMNAAKRGAQAVVKGAKWILEKGKLIFKGLDNAAGRAAKTLRGLGDDILRRVGFKGIKLEIHGRKFFIYGIINPKVLLATGVIDEIPNPRNPTTGKVDRLLKGDRVNVGGVDGVVISPKDAKSMSALSAADKVAEYEKRILTGDSDILAKRMSTPSGEQAHHAMSSSVVKNHPAGVEASKHGWDLNHPNNGVNIPEDKLTTSMKTSNAVDPSKHDLPIWHKGGHTRAYYDATTSELDAVWNLYNSLPPAGQAKFNWIKEMNKASQNMVNKLKSGDVRLYND